MRPRIEMAKRREERDADDPRAKADEAASRVVERLMAKQVTHTRVSIAVAVVVALASSLGFFFDIGPRSVVFAGILGIVTGLLFAAVLATGIGLGVRLSRRAIRRRAAAEARRIEHAHGLAMGTLDWIERMFTPDARRGRGAAWTDDD